MRLLVVTALVCLHLLGWTSQESASDISQDFELLTKLFSGLYDNVKQFEDDIARGLPPKQRHIRYTTQVNPESVPLFPQRRHFYIEQYTNGSRRNVIRQALYSFGLDSKRDEIRMKIYGFVDPGKFFHAEACSRLFRDLAREDLTYHAGCDVLWRREASWPPRFEASAADDCVIDYQGMKVRIDDTNNVTWSALTSYEKWYAPNGTEILGVPSPYVMLRQPQLDDSANPREVTKSNNFSAKDSLLYKSWLKILAKG